MLKSLAMRNRASPKDAYDLDWMLRAYPGGIEAISQGWRRLPATDEVALASLVLREDFSDDSSIGPMSVARFLGRSNDRATRVDSRNRVLSLLDAIA